MAQATDLSSSLITGVTKYGCAIVNQINAGNGAPTTAAQGVPFGMFDKIDVVAEETNGGTYDFIVWLYYGGLINLWVADAAVGSVSLSANSTAGALNIDFGCASKVYVQLTNFAGGAIGSAFVVGRGARHR